MTFTTIVGRKYASESDFNKLHVAIMQGIHQIPKTKKAA